MYLQLKSYNEANEILYVLRSVDECTNNPVSKLGVQKLLYLSASLAPIKEIILSFLKFRSMQRGPYSKNIQNILDHLVAYDLVQITSFKVLFQNNSIAYYQITNGGIEAVNQLVKYSKEEEKYWWINSVTQIANIYSQEEELQKYKEFTGIDNIVKLVYQDPTFVKVKEDRNFKALIDFKSKEGITYQLIKFTENYIKKNKEIFSYKNDRKKSELILIAFFEFLFSKYLDRKQNE